MKPLQASNHNAKKRVFAHCDRNGYVAWVLIRSKKEKYECILMHVCIRRLALVMNSLFTCLKWILGVEKKD